MIAVPYLRNYLYFILLTASSLSAAEPDSIVFEEHTLTADLLVAMVMRENPGIAELSAAAEAAAFSVEPPGPSMILYSVMRLRHERSVA